jgi:hypothetical protein
LIQMLQELRPIYKTRNQFYGKGFSTRGRWHLVSLSPLG